MRRATVIALGALAFVSTLLAFASAQPTPAKRDLKIAMIAKSTANFVFISARQGADDTALALSRKHGVKVEVVWLTPAKEDATVQTERVAQAVREGAQAILIACSDAAKLTPAINEAVDKGVAVMTFDGDAPASRRFAFYGADDVDLGEKVMVDLAELMGGKGKIAILAGNPDAPNLKTRVESVRRVAKSKGIDVVEVVNHIETPQEAAAAVLRVNAGRPDLGGWAMVGGWPLFRSSQTPALVADFQKRKVKVVAVDALPDELIYVERGLVPVLWAQPTYLWGKVGVETIVDKLLFNKAFPEKIRMEPVRVSRANLGTWARQLKTWGFTGIPTEYLALK